jgi:hypothetical protein
VYAPLQRHRLLAAVIDVSFAVFPILKQNLTQMSKKIVKIAMT